MSSAPYPPIHAAPVVELPPDWEEHTDAASGASFYINAITNDIVFERPQLEPAEPAAAATQPSSVRTPRRSNSFGRRASGRVAATASAAASSLLSTASAAIFGTPPPDGSSLAASLPRRRVQVNVRALPEQPGSYAVDVPIQEPDGPRPVTTELFIGVFLSEAAANAAARHEAPPLWTDADNCQRCGNGFGLLRRRTHCRNCGYSMCRSCTKTWPRQALPSLFPKDNGEVCPAAREVSNPAGPSALPLLLRQNRRSTALICGLTFACLVLPCAQYGSARAMCAYLATRLRAPSARLC